MKKIVNKIIAGSAMFLPLIVLADAKIDNPLGSSITSIPLLVARGLEYVVKIGAIVAIMYLIYAGFLYVKAQGNPSEVEKAHEAFKNTIIGIAILLGAQVIASIITGTVGAILK